MIKDFLARFPEFKEEHDAGGKETILHTLAAAESELNPSIWGTLFNEGIFYLAADKLMRCDIGEALRDQQNPTAKSSYAIEFERLSRIASMGARVL